VSHQDGIAGLHLYRLSFQMSVSAMSSAAVDI
jgi:hypothetical protein